VVDQYGFILQGWFREMWVDDIVRLVPVPNPGERRHSFGIIIIRINNIDDIRFFRNFLEFFSGRGVVNDFISTPNYILIINEIRIIHIILEVITGRLLISMVILFSLFTNLGRVSLKLIPVKFGWLLRGWSLGNRCLGGWFGTVS
jgi:hypothetical protein